MRFFFLLIIWDGGSILYHSHMRVYERYKRLMFCVYEDHIDTCHMWYMPPKVVHVSIPVGNCVVNYSKVKKVYHFQFNFFFLEILIFWKLCIWLIKIPKSNIFTYKLATISFFKSLTSVLKILVSITFFFFFAFLISAPEALVNMTIKIYILVYLILFSQIYPH